MPRKWEQTPSGRWFVLLATALKFSLAWCSGVKFFDALRVFFFGKQYFKEKHSVLYKPINYRWLDVNYRDWPHDVRIVSGAPMLLVNFASFSPRRHAGNSAYALTMASDGWQQQCTNLPLPCHVSQTQTLRSTHPAGMRVDVSEVAQPVKWWFLIEGWAINHSHRAGRGRQLKCKHGLDANLLAGYLFRNRYPATRERSLPRHLQMAKWQAVASGRREKLDQFQKLNGPTWNKKRPEGERVSMFLGEGLIAWEDDACDARRKPNGLVLRINSTLPSGTKMSAGRWTPVPWLHATNQREHNQSIIGRAYH